MKACLLAALILASPFAMAKEEISMETGNDFLARAQLFERIDAGRAPADPDNMDKLYYLFGAVSAMQNVNSALGSMHRMGKSEPRFVACIPKGVTARQLILLLKTGLEKSPESLHLPYSFVSQLTLVENYPCPG